MHVVLTAAQALTYADLIGWWRSDLEQAYTVPAADHDSWGFVASPAIAGDIAFAADLEGRVYAFKTE